MGIFNRLKQKKESGESRKRRLMAILSSLGCNPHDFEHQKMNSSEISLKEELDGVIKISDLTYEDGKGEFDYISLSDNSDGTKLLFLAINFREPRETKKLIDKYNIRLGKDFDSKNEFTSNDLYAIENEPNGHLRTWYLTYFEVLIGFTNRGHKTSTYVVVKEKNNFN